jgi:hypothetical protein
LGCSSVGVLQRWVTRNRKTVGLISSIIVFLSSYM